MFKCLVCYDGMIKKEYINRLPLEQRCDCNINRYEWSKQELMPLIDLSLDLKDKEMFEYYVSKLNS